MTNYVLEARSLEHRCQCCGESASAVFCEDCDPHAAEPKESVQSSAGSPQHTVWEQTGRRRRH